MSCKIPACKSTRGLHTCHRCGQQACRHHLKNYSSPAPTCGRCADEITQSWQARILKAKEATR